MLFATPKFFIQAITATHRLGWKPQVYIASVSIEPTIMGIARFNAPELTKGALSIAFVKNPNDPIWAKDKAVALYRSIMRRHNPGGKPTDVYNWYGMTVAWTMVETLRKAGQEPDPRRPSAGRAEPRHGGEPVPATRDPPEDVANGLPPAGAGVPLPLRQQAVGEGERDSPGEGMTRPKRCDRLDTPKRRAHEETDLDQSSPALAAVAALIAVPAAMAAYTSPKLEVTRAGTGTVVKASLNPNDDPTGERVASSRPARTQLTTNQAPGTVLGPVQAIVKALDLAGADLPLEGQLVVAAPGQVPAATQAACIGTATPLATWVHGADGGRADSQRCRRT